MRQIADRWWLVGITLVLAALGASWALYGAERSHQVAQQTFTEHQAVQMLRESTNDVLAQELELARILGTIESPIGNRWPTFANLVMSQGASTSAGLVQPITERGRAAFERRAGIRMTESPRPGELSPAARRPLHLVLTQFVQKTHDRSLLGLDLAANPLRRRLLLQAARTGAQTATPPVQFLSGASQRPGVIVYAPIDDPAGRVQGWVTASYGLSRLVDPVSARYSGVRLAIEDGNDVLAAGLPHHGGYRSRLAVAGRTWTVWAIAPAVGTFLSAWLVLGFGLCLATTVSLILRQATTRERHATGALAARDAEEAALRRIATLVAEKSAPEDVFMAVAEQVGTLLGAHIATVSRFEPERNLALRVGGWAPAGEELIGSTFPLDGGSASAEVFRTGRSCRTLGYLWAGDDLIASRMNALGSAGGIAAPIVIAGTVWGAIGAAYANVTIPPGAEARLERFAQLVGLAISNAEAWARLARQASTDSLTGVANRRAFDERLAVEMARVRRYGRSLGLALLDLDHFKRINDGYGHQAGDDVLVRFASLLGANARDGELIARIGGEEFAWLMPETDEEGAYNAAERVRVALAGELFPGIGMLTVSGGVRSVEESDAADELIRGADDALYWAKTSGRNTTFRFSQTNVAVGRSAG